MGPQDSLDESQSIGNMTIDILILSLDANFISTYVKLIDVIVTLQERKINKTIIRLFGLLLGLLGAVVRTKADWPNSVRFQHGCTGLMTVRISHGLLCFMIYILHLNLKVIAFAI